jgi:hypothetical protein
MRVMRRKPSGRFRPTSAPGWKAAIDGFSRPLGRDFQHALNVPMQPLAFLKHDAEEPIALAVRQVRVVDQDFREASDRRQRRSQVVGEFR